MTVLDDSANGRQINASCGETFEIRLKETPTTGFLWQVVSDGAPTCALVGDSFHAPKHAVPGRSGEHRWTFRVEHAGRTAIELASQRSWEQDATPAKVFRVTVTATD